MTERRHDIKKEAEIATSIVMDYMQTSSDEYSSDDDPSTGEMMDLATNDSVAAGEIELISKLAGLDRTYAAARILKHLLEYRKKRR